jgi:hypothetical protein
MAYCNQRVLGPICLNLSTQTTDRSVRPDLLSCGWRFRRGFLPVPFVEAIHASCSVNQLLFASEKWVACRTDLNMQVALFCGVCLKGLAARASYRNLIIFRVNSWFHYLLEPQL